jgi:hypothetical protein
MKWELIIYGAILDKVISIKREFYRIRINITISFTWNSWYIFNHAKVVEICKVLDEWNQKLTSFPSRYPLFNKSIFLNHYKYWIYWIRRMDPRERSNFNEFRPYLLINDEDWIHLDLTTKGISVVYYTYYFPLNEWKRIEIFKSIKQFENYLRINESSHSYLSQYVESLVQFERLAIGRARMESKGDIPSRLIIDEGGIRLHQNYIKE